MIDYRDQVRRRFSTYDPVGAIPARPQPVQAPAQAPITGTSPLDQMLAQQRETGTDAASASGTGNMVERAWGRGLGFLVNNPATSAVLPAVGGGIKALGLPMRALATASEEAALALPDWAEMFVNPLSTIVDEDKAREANRSFKERLWDDPTYGWQELTPDTGNKWVDRGVGFAGDVLFDPLTYLTVGVAPIAGKAGRASGAQRLLTAANTAGDAAQADRLRSAASQLGKTGYGGIGQEAFQIAAPNARRQGVRFMGRHLGGDTRLGELSEVAANRLGKATGEVGARIRGAPGAGEVRSRLGRVPPKVGEAYETMASGATGQQLETAVNTINDYQRIRLGEGRFGALARPIGDKLQRQVKEARKGGMSEVDLLEAHELGDTVPMLASAGSTIAKIAESMGVKLNRRQNWVPHQLLPDARRRLQELFLDDEGARRAALASDNVFTEDLLRPSGVLDRRVFTPQGGVEKSRTVNGVKEKFRDGTYRRTTADGAKVEIRLETGTIRELNEKLPQLFPELGDIKFYEDRIPALYRNYIDDLAGDVGGVTAFTNAALDPTRANARIAPERPATVRRGVYEVGEDGRLVFDEGKAARSGEESAAKLAEDLEAEGVYRLVDDAAEAKAYEEALKRAAQVTGKSAGKFGRKQERQFRGLINSVDEAITSLTGGKRPTKRQLDQARKKLDELESAKTRGGIGYRNRLERKKAELQAKITEAELFPDERAAQAVADDPYAVARMQRDQARQELADTVTELEGDIAKFTGSKEALNDFISEGGLDKYLPKQSDQLAWLRKLGHWQNDMNYGPKKVSLKRFEDGHLPPDQAQAKIEAAVNDLIVSKDKRAQLEALQAEATTEIPDAPLGATPIEEPAEAASEAAIEGWRKEIADIDAKIETGKYLTKAEYDAARKQAREQIATMERNQLLEGLRKEVRKMTDAEGADLSKQIEALEKLGDVSGDPALSKADEYLRAAAVMASDAKTIKMTEAQVEKVLKDISNGKIGKVLTVTIRDEWEEIFKGMSQEGDILITPELAQMWRNLREIEKQPGRFGRAARGYTNLFKTYATATPGFHLRNGVSATFMNASDGVTPANMVRGAKEWAKFAKAVKEGNGWQYYQALDDDMKRAFDGVFGSGTGGQYLESGVGQRAEVSGRVVEKAFNNFYTKMLGRRPGQFVEGGVRLGMAIDSVGRGYDAIDIMNRITRVHFDYSQVSAFDQKMKQFIPFWTFMSRNLPLQIHQMWTKPKVYRWWEAATRNLGEDAEAFTPEYILENGGIPISEGPIQFFFQPDLAHQRISQDVGMIEDALSFEDPTRALSTMNPGLTAPAEFMLRKDFFTGKEYDETDLVKLGGAEKGLAPILRMLNLAQVGPDGEVYAEERAIAMLQSMVPIYDRAGRVAPRIVQGERGTEDATGPLGALSLEGALRYAGSPVRSVNQEDRDRFARGQRYDELDRKRREIALMKAASGG